MRILQRNGLFFAALCVAMFGVLLGWGCGAEPVKEPEPEQVVQQPQEQEQAAEQPQEQIEVPVVDQNGVETSLTGTWELIEVNHANSHHAVGKTKAFPPDPFPIEVRSEGTFADPDGVLWTKVYAAHEGDRVFFFLERVDTSVEPARWIAVLATNEDGSPRAGYPEPPFDPPSANVMVWQKR